MSPKTDFSRERNLFRDITEMQISTAKEYYDMGLPAEETYQKPGTPGRKTTQKLFKYWDQLYLEEYGKMSTHDRQVIVKGRIKITFSKLLYGLNYQLNLVANQVEDERKFHETHNENLVRGGRKDEIRPFNVNIGLENLRLRIMREMRETVDFMATLEVTPIAYELTDQQILADLKEREELMRAKFNRFSAKRNEKNENKKNFDLG